MIKNNINEVKKESMSNFLMSDYLKNPNIMIYNELGNIDNIEDILPNNNDYVILLYERFKNDGHWVCILRINDTIEYFDSYGKNVDYAIDNWFKENKEQQNKYLSNLLNKTELKVFTNPIDYQNTNSDISTCGRHCIFRILNMLKYNRDLSKYYQLMETLKKKTGYNYDEIVSYMINLID